MAQAQTISFESSEGTSSGYLARPERRSRDGRPGVVVIQEWWGLVPHIKDVTRRFAEQGYIALAPDLYHGKTTVEAEEAHHLAEGLDWGRAAAEMAGAVRYLREREGTTSVGVVGFCMGGALAMIAATGEGVDAYASFYGFPPAGAAPVDEIEEPGVIFFGSEEDNFSVPDVQAFAERQQAKGRETEVVVYEGAGHAFFNDTRPKAYNADAAAAAWQRTLELFERTLH